MSPRCAASRTSFIPAASSPIRTATRANTASTTWRWDVPNRARSVTDALVICAGTSGYSATVDLRYHWTRQKRLQGSHGTNDEQAVAYNDLVRAGTIDPVMGRVLGFGDVPRAHAEMGRGEEVFGNPSILVGAARPGLGRR